MIYDIFVHIPLLLVSFIINRLLGIIQNFDVSLIHFLQKKMFRCISFAISEKKSHAPGSFHGPRRVCWKQGSGFQRYVRDFSVMGEGCRVSRGGDRVAQELSDQTAKLTSNYLHIFKRFGTKMRMI